jgi:hypothetical protein
MKNVARSSTKKFASLAVLALSMVSGGHAWAASAPNGEVYGIKAKFVDVNGIKNRYYELGQGEPMVPMIVINKADHSDFRQYVEEYNLNIANFIDYWEHQPGQTTAQAK